MKIDINKISIQEPKSFQEVKQCFKVCGKCHSRLFESSHKGISLNLIDINGKTISGSSLDLFIRGDINNDYVSFEGQFCFDQSNVPFIIESRGRMTVRLYNFANSDYQIYIPIVVEEFAFEVDKTKEIIEKHRNIGKMIEGYKNDLKIYAQELEKIIGRRFDENCIEREDRCKYVEDWKMTNDLREILEEADGFDESYPFVEADLKEVELNEKFKDALEWRGPLFGAVVGNLNGFEFRVYSNDHDRHFHVLHQGKGINARFSFPGIELINYKTVKNSMGSKEIKMVQGYFRKDRENLIKLEKEFLRIEEYKKQ